MARKLAYIAQDVMNVYNQDYKATSDFFDLEDFVSYCGMAYADLLSQEYDAERARMRSEGEETNISFSHDWLQTQVIKVKYNQVDGYAAELTHKPMSFPYDKWDSGIQNVFDATRQLKDELIRSNISENWMDEFMPLGCVVTWSLLKDKIIVNAGGKVPPMTLRVVYVPEVSEDLEIPQTREKMIMDSCLQLMFTAAQKLIKEVNDQNMNKTQLSETNRELVKQ